MDDKSMSKIQRLMNSKSFRKNLSRREGKRSKKRKEEVETRVNGNKMEDETRGHRKIKE